MARELSKARVYRIPTHYPKHSNQKRISNNHIQPIGCLNYLSHSLMDMNQKPLSDDSSLSISLSYLVQIVAAIGVGVWGYSQLDGRISTLQSSSDMYREEIERIQENMEKNQDQPISSDHVQNTKLYFIENNLEQMLNRIEKLEQRIYEINQEKEEE